MRSRRFFAWPRGHFARASSEPGPGSPENELHKEVGAGPLTLQAAQAILATDWFKYFLG